MRFGVSTMTPKSIIRNMRRFALLAAPLPAVIACSSTAASSPDVSTRPASSDANQAVKADTLAIPVGATAKAQGGRVRVTFEERLQDSRCPANVVCVWEGDASVRVNIATDRSATTTELHTTLKPKELLIDGYSVSLVGLLPYPGSAAEKQSPVALVRVALAGS